MLLVTLETLEKAEYEDKQRRKLLKEKRRQGPKRIGRQVLVPKRRTVQRRGQSFETTVYVDPTKTRSAVSGSGKATPPVFPRRSEFKSEKEFLRSTKQYFKDRDRPEPITHVEVSIVGAPGVSPSTPQKTSNRKLKLNQIGKTSSGMTVFDNKDPKKYKGASIKDHLEAASVHLRVARLVKKPAMRQHHKVMYREHGRMAQELIERAYEKGKEVDPKLLQSAGLRKLSFFRDI